MLGFSGSFLLALVVTSAQQKPVPVTPPPQGAVTGVVIDGATAGVVAGAAVHLTGGNANGTYSARQITDEKGRFAFVEVPLGEVYTLSASKPGYLNGGYGRDAAPTDPLRLIQIKHDEWLSNVRVTIWKPGSISGSVRDETGEPVVGVYVRALARVRIQGRDEVAAGLMTVTDDRGEYRLPGLSPGRYVIQVPSVQATIPAGTTHRMSPSPADIDGAVDIDDTTRLVIGRYPLPPPRAAGKPMAYPPAFHPAAASVADATVVELKYGDDRPGIDVRLTPAPAVRVTGLVDAPPEALQFLTLRLLPAGLENLGQGAEVATAFVGTDGRFTFLNVPAGTYTIDAPLRINELVATSSSSQMYFPPPPGRSGWSRTTETIDAAPNILFMSTGFRGDAGANYSGRSSVSAGPSDVSGVVVRLRPNATMTLRVAAEQAPNRSDSPPGRYNILLDPAGGEAGLGMPRPGSPSRTGDDGQLTIGGIAPGRYWLRVINPNWLVKSIVWKGRDFVNEPFDAAVSDDFSGVVVTVTNNVPQLSGAVRSSNDLKADQTMVIAFPVDPAMWKGFGLWPSRLKAASVSTTGAYRFSDLPAGDYYVAAIDRVHTAVWRDPAFLTQVARFASRLTLTWGTLATQDVTAGVVR